MTDHIGKPFELTDLVQCLLRHTGRQQAAAALADKGPLLDDLRLSPQALSLSDEGGVDVLTAVGRLGGQVGVYERMLRGFLRDVPALLTRLDDAVRAASWDQAAVEMHTLKGLAGTLGLSSLQADSAEAERALRQGVSSREAEQQVERVLTHVRRLQSVGAALAAALQACAEGRDAQAGQALTAEELQGHLHVLEALLRRSDMGALTVLEPLRGPLIQALGQRFAELDHAVQALDFDRAAQICNALAGSLLSPGVVRS